MTESTPIQRVKIKIGNAEFEAEGNPDDVQRQYEAFMEVVGKSGAQLAPVVSPAPLAFSPPASAMGAGAATGTVRFEGIPSGVDDDLLARVFRRDGDALSLLALPTTDEAKADTLIALLYGFQRLLGRSNTNGYVLIRAARQSGVDIPRVDTTIAKRSEFVLAAGAKRGRVYSLNNRGMAYAEDLLRRMVE